MAAKPITAGIYTIGHSNQELQSFFALLTRHGIQTLADVRSRPGSPRFPWFNREVLNGSLYRAGIRYVFLGEELGGYPEDPKLYDDTNRVIYERVVDRHAELGPRFKAGIRKVMEIAETTKLVLMCSQGDPRNCHRHPLLALELLDRGYDVQHIMPNGTLTAAADLFQAASASPQLSLFEIAGEDKSWRSPEPDRKWRKR